MSTHAADTTGKIAQAAGEMGLSNLLVPSTLITVSELPLLGSDKLDYTGVRKLAEQQLSMPSAPPQGDTTAGRSN